MATQSGKVLPPPCVKLLAREALSHLAPPPSSQPAWLQGYVVWVSATRLILDDGSGVVAVVDHAPLADVDVCVFADHSIGLGAYVLVVGKVAPGAKGEVAVEASAVRNLSSKKNAAMLEALWNSEVVDSWIDLKEADAV